MVITFGLYHDILTTMNEEMTPATKSQSWAIPIAIILGFGLIAVAIYLSQTKAPPESGNQQNNGDEEVKADGKALNPITADDHIRGNPNAPILIVEYSDYDCPFCKQFHETMQRIIEEYGAGGRVAWVYRHFPLESLHPSAPHIAEASECVASLAGNDAFWKFSDLIFGEREIDELTNMARLEEFATTAGAKLEEFEGCMDTREKRAEVEADFQNAVAIGARGTPYSVILIGEEQIVINGAQPYTVVKQMIDSLAGQLGGTVEN